VFVTQSGSQLGQEIATRVVNFLLMMKRLKWMCKIGREQPNDFCAVSYNTLVKRWDKCISVGGGYVEK
jgi:hypothetical protein